jgi:hypothetical protein
MVPPSPLMIPWQRERPSPVPLPMGLVVKKGSKILDAIRGSTPGPESETSTMT